MEVILGVSNRHIHVSKKDLEILFGSGYELTNIRDLLQPGQYASKETVTIRSDFGSIDKVRIIGPVRPYTQVEISKTDAIKLKINPPIRDSGDLENSEKVTIIGPNGKVTIDNGCIIAARHIHMTPDDKTKMGLDDVTEVSVEINGIKGGILHHVNLKVAEASTLEFHIDTDDSNAHLAKTGDLVKIIKEDKNA